MSAIPQDGRRFSATHLIVFLSSLIFSGVNLGASSQFSDFLDGLGPAQLVGRQTLATPAIGEFAARLSCTLMFSFPFFFFLF